MIYLCIGALIPVYSLKLCDGSLEKLVAFYSNRTASETLACKANYGAGQVPFLFGFGISSIKRVKTCF